jgi:hypothetical protein
MSTRFFKSLHIKNPKRLLISMNLQRQLDNCPSSQIIYASYVGRGKPMKYFTKDETGKHFCNPQSRLVPGQTIINKKQTKSCEAILRQLDPIDIITCDDIINIPIYRINGHSDQLLQTQLSISTYLPEIIIYGLQYVPNDTYIFCPLYVNGDVQIGVTGHCHFDETPEQAITRELSEEIGLTPIDVSHFFIDESLAFNHDLFVIPLSETIPTNVPTKSGSDSQNRVAALVYGSQDEVYNYLSGKKIHLWKSYDNIIGILALRIDIARYLVSRITM